MAEELSDFNKNQPKGNVPLWRAGVEMFSLISTWIVVPIVAALIIGKYLDRRLDTEPWIFLFSAGFAFLITCLGILRIVKDYVRETKDK